VLVSTLVGFGVFAQAPSADFTATSALSGCSPLIVSFQDLSTGSPTQWTWDFGNGTIVNVQNPAAQAYTLPGTYTVKLTVRNASGVDSMVKLSYVTVFANPVVDFSASQLTGCFPLNTTFTPNITIPGGGSVVKYEWGFGDGDSSQLANPTHVYRFDNNFNVTLRVTTNQGCVNFTTKNGYINVNPGVTPAFYNSFASACRPPANIDFFNNSTGPGALSYTWKFGDGTTSSTASPSHSYNTSGTFPVTMIVTSSAGCSDSALGSVDIPNATITSSISAPDTSCIYQYLTFTSISSPAADSSGWKFGDGTESTGTSITKTYTVPGTYTVTLTNLFTSCLDSITKRIVILDTAAVNFTSNDSASCSAPFTVQFTAQAPQATSYSWDFGDGNTSTAANPTHTYNAIGNYRVILTITNRNGCTSTRIKNNYIRIAPPSVRFLNLPDSGCAPLVVNPTAQIIAPDGVQSYFWDFGTSTSTLANPTITYNSTGNYGVSLRITTRTGCLETISLLNAVKVGVAPTANFTASPLLSCAADSVSFTDLSTGTVTGYLWEFGDPGSSNPTSTAKDPKHLYSDTGTFSVRLRVFNNGCENSITRTNYIRTYGAVAKFGFLVNCNINRREVQFLDSSINVVTRQWDFGDGNTSTAVNPTHTYAAFGYYVVTLTVSDGTCTYVFRRPVKVVNENANFTVSPTTLCRGANTTFRANAIDSNILRYEWDFGTGMLMPGNDTMIVVFDTPRVYNTVLAITDINGCTDTVTRAIGVGGPRAAFNAINPTGCVGNTVNFTDNSLTDGVNAIVSRMWSFGDGVTQTINTPPVSHQYNTTGFFNVVLTVTDAAGCVDSMVQNSLVVTTRPRASFTSPDSLSCPGRNVQFLTTSTGVNLVHSWSFGDGQTNVGAPNPRNTYAAPGQYDVRLVVRDRYGCPDTITRTRYINIDTPYAAFTVSSSTINCPPLIALFQFTGRYNQTIRWDFGDGDAALNKDTATKFYGIPGTYRAQLVVTSPGGCTDTAFQNISIFGPSGTLNYVPANGCAPLTINFTLSTQNTDSVKWFFGDNNVSIGKDTIISHTYVDRGTYRPIVFLKDVTGCEYPISLNDSIKVVDITPQFVIENNQICDAGIVRFRDSTITNGSILGWSWDFGDGGTGTGPAPQHYYSAPGLYSVKLRVTTEFGCTDSITLPNSVRVVASPVTAINSVDTVCQNRSITFAGVVVVPDTSALTWKWHFANGDSSSLQNPPAQPYTIPGTYTVRLISTNSSGCQDTALRVITVHPLPNLNAGLDTTICLGQSVVLNATGAATYSWLAPNTSLSCTGCASPTANPIVTTVYNVRGVSAQGCSVDDSIRVTVIQPSTVVAPPADSLCIGQGIQLFATGTQVYSWSPSTGLSNPNASSPIARPTTTTTYVVTGSDARGCFITRDSVTISVFPYPVFDLGRDTTITVGSSVQLNPNRSNDITSIVWSPVNGLSCTDCPDPLATPKQRTTYTATVTNNGGCVTKDELTIFVVCTNENIFIPNTFSPNNDGMNDLFYVRGRGLTQIRSVKIFNRWGQQVFLKTNVIANDAGAGWDGTFKGQPLSPDVYVYMVEVVCENNALIMLKGDVMLVR
jgi:gliding motility-associated-like protein